MKPLLCLLTMLCVCPALCPQQQKTLTVSGCRADAQKLSVEVHQPNALAASYFVWSARADEMSQCQDVDPAIPADVPSIQRGILYIGLENAARVAMIQKLNTFVQRHGLQKQFIDDDDAGL